MFFDFKAVRKLILAKDLSNPGFEPDKFELAGFELDETVEEEFDRIRKISFFGFNVSVEYGSCKDLNIIASSISKEVQGFFYEGVGIGLYLIDRLSFFKKNHFFEFSQNISKPNESIMYVGAGVGMAILKRSFKKFIKKADPFYGVQIFDGMGFYQALKDKRIGRDLYVPKDIKNNPEYLDCYDNGVGRALWFHNNTDPVKVAEAIAQFSEERQHSLWRGVGLASSYAIGGQIKLEKYVLIRELAGKYAEWLAVGSFVAVAFRQMHCPVESDYEPVIENALIRIHPEECYRKEREIYHECIANKESFHDYLNKIKNIIPKEVTLYDAAHRSIPKEITLYDSAHRRIELGRSKLKMP